MVTHITIATKRRVALEWLASEKLLDARHEVFEEHTSCLLKVIVVEEVKDGWAIDVQILALGQHVELVNDFLVHDADWLATQELKSFHELLSWYVLW